MTVLNQFKRVKDATTRLLLLDRMTQPDNDAKSMLDAIQFAFAWSESPEGYMWWIRLKNAMQDYPGELVLDTVHKHLHNSWPCDSHELVLYDLIEKTGCFVHTTKALTPAHALHLLLDASKPDGDREYYFHILKYGTETPESRSIETIMQGYCTNLVDLLVSRVYQAAGEHRRFVDLHKLTTYLHISGLLPEGHLFWDVTARKIEKLNCPSCDSFLELDTQTASCVNCDFKIQGDGLPAIVDILTKVQQP